MDKKQDIRTNDHQNYAHSPYDNYFAPKSNDGSSNRGNYSESLVTLSNNNMKSYQSETHSECSKSAFEIICIYLMMDYISLIDSLRHQSSLNESGLSSQFDSDYCESDNNNHRYEKNSSLRCSIESKKW